MKRHCCSVVICTRYRSTPLERCLTAMMAVDHPSFDLLVVDNTPGDPEAARLAARFGARYVQEPRTGLSRARNTGACAALGEIVAFIDDDAVPGRGWLRAHTDALEDSTLTVTTGRVLPIDPGNPASLKYSAIGGDDLGARGFTTDMTSADWFDRANFGGVGVGENFALRRRLFESGWRFREDLGLGTEILGEEHYAFFDLIRSGHRIRYVPEAVVRHEAPATLDDVAKRKRRTLRSSGAYLVMLLVEERGYRLPALLYALRSLRGQRRPWRPGVVDEPFAGRLEILQAALAGPVIYVRRWLTSKSNGTS